MEYFFIVISSNSILAIMKRNFPFFETENHWPYATLSSRCSKTTVRKLPRCGAGPPAKSTYCDLSSFGPALFEIRWPDIYLGGPYGPVKDEMYWPELGSPFGLSIPPYFSYIN